MTALMDISSLLLEEQLEAVLLPYAEREADKAHEESIRRWEQALETKDAASFEAAATSFERSASAFDRAGKADLALRGLFHASTAAFAFMVVQLQAIAAGASTQAKHPRDLLEAGQVDEMLERARKARAVARELGESEIECRTSVQVVGGLSINVHPHDEASVIVKRLEELLEEVERTEQLCREGCPKVLPFARSAYAHTIFRLTNFRGTSALKARAIDELRKALELFVPGEQEDQRVAFLQTGLRFQLGSLLSAVATEAKNVEELVEASQHLYAAIVALKTHPMLHAMGCLGLGVARANHGELTGEAESYRVAADWHRAAAKGLQQLGRPEQEMARVEERKAIARWLELTESEVDKPRESVLPTEGDNEEEGRIADDAAAVETTVDASADFAGAVGALKSRLVPTVTDQDIAELEAVIREAQQNPPEDRATFVADINRVLEACGLRLEMEDGKLARLKHGFGGSIQFGVPGASRGFRKASFQVVRVTDTGRKSALEPEHDAPQVSPK